MKMIVEYLEKAIHFEQLAAAEQAPELKEQLAAQARAYRKLVEERAHREGLPIPLPPFPPQSK